MQISDQRIDDFIERWKRALEETLNRDEARLHADSVVDLYRTMLRSKQAMRDVGDDDPKPAPLPSG